MGFSPGWISNFVALRVNHNQLYSLCTNWVLPSREHYSLYGQRYIHRAPTKVDNGYIEIE